MTNSELMDCGLDIGRKKLAVTMNQIKALGYVTLQADGQRANRWRVVPGALPPIVGLLFAPQFEVTPPGERACRLALQASGYLCKNPRGSDSGKLATLLDANVQEVEAALSPAVAQGRLVACTLIRGGATLTAYRVSAKGAARYGWALQAAATWQNSRAQAMEAAP